MIRDGLRIVHVGRARRLELGRVVAGDPGVVDQQLDPVGLFGCDLTGEAFDGVLFADITYDSCREKKMSFSSEILGANGKTINHRNKLMYPRDDFARSIVIQVNNSLQSIWSPFNVIDLGTVGYQSLNKNKNSRQAKQSYKGGGGLEFWCVSRPEQS